MLRCARPATLLLATALPAGAAIVEVCPSGCPHTLIQAAITAASPNDVVRILTSLPHTESDIVVDRDLTIEGLGRSFTTVQAAATPGSALARVFFVTPGIAVTLRDMTIRHGFDQSTGEGGAIYNNGADLTLEDVDLVSNWAYNSGGGVYSAGGTLTVLDCGISQNQARDGAGIYNLDGASLLIEDSQINFNDDADRGGGLFNSGSAVVLRSEISYNSADESSGFFYQGGGVYNDGMLEISDTTIAGNDVSHDDIQSGGGGIFSSGMLTLTDSIVESNSSAAFTYGGGVRLVGGAASIVRTSIRNNTNSLAGGLAVSSSALVLERSTIRDNSGSGIYAFDDSGTIVASTISGNTAYAGAGINCQACTLDLINSTISGNEALWHGGGAYVSSGASIRFASSTITDNSCDSDVMSGGDGGGVFVDAGGAATLRNSILASNHDAGANLLHRAPDCAGALSSSGYNLVRSLGFNSLGDPPCSLSGGTEDLVGQDPMLGPLQNNGGPTFTHALPPESPAADSAHPAGCVDFDGVPIADDQRGVPRANRCDRGAYEIESPFFADGFESGDTSSWSAAVP